MGRGSREVGMVGFKQMDRLDKAVKEGIIPRYKIKTQPDHQLPLYICDIWVNGLRFTDAGNTPQRAEKHTAERVLAHYDEI